MLLTLTPGSDISNAKGVVKTETVHNERLKISYYLPDTKVYFVLTDVINEYKALKPMNTTPYITDLLVDDEEGFSIHDTQLKTHELATQMFGESRLMEGKELAALHDAVKKSLKSKPTLPNRL